MLKPTIRQLIKENRELSRQVLSGIKDVNSYIIQEKVIEDDSNNIGIWEELKTTGMNLKEILGVIKEIKLQLGGDSQAEEGRSGLFCEGGLNYDYYLKVYKTDTYPNAGDYEYLGEGDNERE